MIMRLFSFKLYDYIFSCFRIVWNLREAFLSSNFQLHQIPYYFKGGVSPLPSYIYQFIIKCLDFYNELIWLISYREHWESSGTLPCPIYAKLHMATALPDSSIQPVSDRQVQNDASQNCKCGYTVRWRLWLL